MGGLAVPKRSSSWVDRQLAKPWVQKYGWVVLLLSVSGVVVVSSVLTQKRATRLAKAFKGTWCTDDDEPRRRGRSPPFKCTSYDLTMRDDPLGDDGAAQLASALQGSRYARPERRRLRRLILQHMHISSAGARRLAQLIAHCADADAEGYRGCALDPSKRFELDVRANPIGQRGVEQLRSAVERARARGMKVVVYAGGKVEEATMKKGPLLKLGALEFQLGRKVDVPQYYDFEFRLPPTWQERVMPRDVSTTLRIRVAIAIIAFLAGVLSTKLHLPFKVIWNEEAVEEAVKTTRRFTQFIGDTFRPNANNANAANGARTNGAVGPPKTATLHAALTAIRDDEDEDEDEGDDELEGEAFFQRSMSQKSESDDENGEPNGRARSPRSSSSVESRVFKPTARFAD